MSGQKKDGIQGFNWETLISLCQRKAKLIDCVDIMGCSSDTIERRIRKEYDMTFLEFQDLKMSVTRNSLVNKALALAQSGNVTMLIFCLKNLCGWADRMEQRLDHTSTDGTMTPQTTRVDPKNLSDEELKVIKNVLTKTA